MTAYFKLFPLKKMQVIVLASPCPAEHALASNKLLDIAHIYLGLTFKQCYMLELFYIYRFYFRHVVMIWEG